MRRILGLATLLVAGIAVAHVTPNVQLIRRGDFVQQSLPGAVKFSEKTLMIGGPDMAAIKQSTGWTPSEEDARVYLGRNGAGDLLGTVVFVWMPSEHGPVGIGVAFDSEGSILRADVTDVGTEPLAWVRPLLQAGAMRGFGGVAEGHAVPPDSLAPGVTGRMNRYYAEVITEGVARAQALERISRTTPAAPH